MFNSKKIMQHTPGMQARTELILLVLRSRKVHFINKEENKSLSIQAASLVCITAWLKWSKDIMTHSFVMPHFCFDLGMLAISIASSCQFCHILLSALSIPISACHPCNLCLSDSIFLPSIVFVSQWFWHHTSIVFLDLVSWLFIWFLCVCMSMEAWRRSFFYQWVSAW